MGAIPTTALQTNKTHLIMKRIVIALAFIIVVMAMRMNQQKQMITSLCSQQNEQLKAVERLLDRIEEDRPNYLLDVLSETDEYAELMELR